MDLKNEPVAIWTTTGALVSALLFQFLPDLGEELIFAIVEWIVKVAPFIAGVLAARMKAYGPVTVEKMTADGQLKEL